jgi:hypothetical protein
VIGGWLFKAFSPQTFTLRFKTDGCVSTARLGAALTHIFGLF